jgi:hypothetical protein
MQQTKLKEPARIPSDPIQRAWIALGRVSQAIREDVALALKNARLPDITWYTVLWELERAAKPTRPPLAAANAAAASALPSVEATS